MALYISFFLGKLTIFNLWNTRILTNRCYVQVPIIFTQLFSSCYTQMPNLSKENSSLFEPSTILILTSVLKCWYLQSQHSLCLRILETWRQQFLQISSSNLELSQDSIFEAAEIWKTGSCRIILKFLPFIICFLSQFTHIQTWHRSYYLMLQ